MNRTRQIVLISVLFFTLMPILSFAGEVNLPRTGQTTCYDSDGNEIICEGTGQDGDIQAGIAWPEPRFEDNGDGTVTDRLTGLIWLKNANCAGTMNWANALAYCNNLASGSCDLTDGSVAGDWRLPNVLELESLSNASEMPAAWLKSHGFSNVQNKYRYSWSSTSKVSAYSLWTDLAWALRMDRGYMNTREKWGLNYAWPVRAGQDAPAQTRKTGQTACYDSSGDVIDCSGTGQDGDIQAGIAWPEPRFEDNGDGTVTDRLTGLIWLKDNKCPGTMIWANALAYCNNLASGSCGLTDGSVAGDWRLPNRKELLSLIDYSQALMALPQGHPFIRYGSYAYFESSTSVCPYKSPLTSFANASKVFYVNIAEGTESYQEKNYPDIAWPLWVWPVRGGQIVSNVYPNGSWKGSGTGSEGRIDFELKLSDGAVTGTITETGEGEGPEQVTGTYEVDNNEVTIHLDEGAPYNTQWDFIGAVDSTDNPTSITGNITGGPYGNEDFSLILNCNNTFSDDAKCLASKMSALAKLYNTYFGIWIKEVTKLDKYPEEKRNADIEKATGKLLASWAKAGMNAVKKDCNCATKKGSDDIEKNVDAQIGAIAGAILGDKDIAIKSGDKDARNLGKALLKAAQKYCNSLLKAEVINVKKRDHDKLGIATFKAEEKFFKRWDKAIEKAGKKEITIADPDGLADAVAGMVEVLAADVLAGMGL